MENSAALRCLLDQAFSAAEQHLAAGDEPRAPAALRSACDVMFASSTQAFREVALGCLLTRLHRPEKDIRLPYIKQGTRAFSGRSLDEQVVNPFLQEHSIPCSKGPYLSVFRRQVRFDETTREGLRDPDGYDAFLSFISTIEKEEDPTRLEALLVYLLFRFLKLREDSQVTLLQLKRISLGQYSHIVEYLLSRPAGGFLAFAVVLSAVRAIQQTFQLDWSIEYQGINVADRPKEAGGDITIRRADEVFMILEVTERPVDRNRVASTFRSKIAPAAADYVFVVHIDRVEAQAFEQAERYFAQEYDVDFVDLKQWVHHTLATLGSSGRSFFQDNMMEILSTPEVSRMTRLAWNEALQSVL